MDRYASLKKNNNKPTNMANYNVYTEQWAADMKYNFTPTKTNPR